MKNRTLRCNVATLLVYLSVGGWDWHHDKAPGWLNDPTQTAETLAATNLLRHNVQNVLEGARIAAEVRSRWDVWLAGMNLWQEALREQNDAHLLWLEQYSAAVKQFSSTAGVIDSEASYEADRRRIRDLKRMLPDSQGLKIRSQSLVSRLQSSVGDSGAANAAVVTLLQMSQNGVVDISPGNLDVSNKVRGAIEDSFHNAQDAQVLLAAQERTRQELTGAMLTLIDAQTRRSLASLAAADAAEVQDNFERMMRENALVASFETEIKSRIASITKLYDKTGCSMLALRRYRAARSLLDELRETFAEQSFLDASTQDFAAETLRLLWQEN